MTEELAASYFWISERDLKEARLRGDPFVPRPFLVGERLRYDARQVIDQSESVEELIAFWDRCEAAGVTWFYNARD